MSVLATTERNGHTLDLLTVNDLRIEVSRLGAELVSLARCNPAGQWTGYLVRDGDVGKNPHGWNNHSTVMGYYVHRILNEKTFYHGHEVRGGTHSFLRHKIFPVPTVGEGSLTYHFSGEDRGVGEYPYRVDFSLTYALRDGVLHISFHFANRENFATHVSFGLHPGFGVTDLATMRVVLPAGRYTRHLAPGNFLNGETEIIDFPGGPMPFPVAELPGSFLLDLAEVPDRIFTLEDPATGRKTTLDYSEVPYLTLWSDGNAINPFICIEPCWGLPDHHVQRPFEEKTGIQLIPPLVMLERSFTICPS